MATQRKRKFDEEVDALKSKQSAASQQPRGIRQFGSIGKGQVAVQDGKRRKTAVARLPTPPVNVSAKPVAPQADKKRKRGLESVVEEASDDERTEAPKTRDAIRTAPDERKIMTPRNKRFKSALPRSPMDTPARGAARLFDKLKLESSSPTLPSSPTRKKPKTAYDTPPDTPDKDAVDSDGYLDQLPTELADLAHLHASFLTALSLHYAHNGTSSQVDLRTLLPMITKSWKKRAVTLEDLRRMLAFSTQQEQSFSLSDYGRAGICLVKMAPRGRALKRAPSYIDENEQNARFEEGLQRSWQTWRASHNASAAAFIAQLSLAEITENSSAQKAAPLFARGQQRLADLKASQAQSRTETLSPKPALPAAAKTTQAVQSRSSSLLDRILAKQALASALPSGPSRAELERKQALQRIEEVARILELLAAGRVRASFSLTAVVQNLQGSLRSPISREEVERCLRLMGGEIMPGFVALIQSGSVNGVVVTKGGRLGVEELRGRVERAGG